MQYQLTHQTTYTYSHPVELTPHTFRLKPRSDPFQRLETYQLILSPTPTGSTEILDEFGNVLSRAWWTNQSITQLTVTAQSTVTTPCNNPFEYLLEPWATQLPWDYPRSLYHSLFPYVSSTTDPFCQSPTIVEWAQNMVVQSNYNPIVFLDALNQAIYQNCDYQSRDIGAAYPAHKTWQDKSGCCRDFVLLFMTACRAVGLAARFVSGYEQGDPKHEQTLHAWAEVYLPGAGWRGYDPTLGLVVCDRHIALAAHVLPEYTAPVHGSHRPQAEVEMESTVNIAVM